MIGTQRIRPALRALCGGAVALLAGMAVAAAQEPTPEAIVDAIENGVRLLTTAAALA